MRKTIGTTLVLLLMLSTAAHAVVSYYSFETPPPAISWIDISSDPGATPLTSIWGRDDTYTSVSIGFGFPFFGTNYTTAYVTTNGLVMFGGGSSQYGNTAIPTTGDANNFIAAFWDDLYTGQVYAKTIGTAPNRKLIIQYKGIRGYYFGANLNFEIILSELDGSILLQYLSGFSGGGYPSGAGATIGVENAAGTEGLQFSYNLNGAITDGKVIKITGDTDHDGFPDYWENLYAAYGTDWNNPALPVPTVDIDGDGLNWLLEYQNGTNPTVVDTDEDGLSDGYEVLTSHTNPTLADTDGDGLPDPWELQYGTNPNSASSPVLSQDVDGDGLNWTQEYQNGTNPLVADTDGDGFRDGWEVQYGTNPKSAASPVASQDVDGDGLSWTQEYQQGTSPLAADSDGDGANDGYEIQMGYDPLNPLSPRSGGSLTDDVDHDGLNWLQEYSAKTNPFLPDTDGDGLTDGYEWFTSHTDPTKADTDGDGLPDGWELQYGTDPLSAGSPVIAQDWDGDGLNWLEEYQTGTDPYNPDTDGDTVSDGAELGLGGNPLVREPDVLVTFVGPGATAGTAYFQFAVMAEAAARAAPVVAGNAATTGYRVYYGATSQGNINNYDAHFDLGPDARAGLIDQKWGMQGVPVVYFRIAPIRVADGHTFIGLPSDEGSTYFSGTKFTTTEPGSSGNQDADSDKSLIEGGGAGSKVCFISTIEAELPGAGLLEGSLVRALAGLGVLALALGAVAQSTRKTGERRKAEDS